jgi:hypothetical protein
MGGHERPNHLIPRSAETGGLAPLQPLEDSGCNIPLHGELVARDSGGDSLNLADQPLRKQG